MAESRDWTVYHTLVTLFTTAALALLGFMLNELLTLRDYRASDFNRQMGEDLTERVRACEEARAVFDYRLKSLEDDVRDLHEMLEGRRSMSSADAGSLP